MYFCKTNPNECDHDRKKAKYVIRNLEMLLDLTSPDMYLCKINPNICDRKRKSSKKVFTNIEMLHQKEDWYDKYVIKRRHRKQYSKVQTTPISKKGLSMK